MEPALLYQILKEGLKHDHLEVDGDGRHFDVTVVSAVFQGKSRIQQHQVIYGILGDRMREEIHALTLKTYTPESWSQRGH